MMMMMMMMMICSVLFSLAVGRYIHRKLH